MNLLALLPLAGVLFFTNPTAVVKRSAFTNIEILYKNNGFERHVKFQLEAYIGNKWVLIDDDVTCKELQSSIIISCSPIAVQREKLLAFSLKDCELVYAYSFEDYQKLLIRLKTVTYHNTKTSYYSDKPIYFEPFWIKK
jgi:hypothetical protein